MVGREIDFSYSKQEPVIKDTILKVRNLSMLDKVHKGVLSVNNVSFDVKGGEIVTIAGIDGNGQSDLVFGITGLDKVEKGNIYIKDKDGNIIVVGTWRGLWIDTERRRPVSLTEEITALYKAENAKELW